MTTPDPRGYSRSSAIARLDLTKQKNEPSHWSFTDRKRTHKIVSTKGRIEKSSYTHAVELKMTYTIKCMSNPLRGSLKQISERQRILNSL